MPSEASCDNPVLIKRRKFKISSKALPWLLITPTMILVFTLSVYPLVYALRVSFLNDIMSNPVGVQWAGLTNYFQSLHDPLVIGAILRTLWFTFITLVIEIPLGTAIAFLLFKKFRAQGIVRALMLLPLACAPLAIGLIWRMMYSADFGVWTYLVRGIFGHAPDFLGNTQTALGSIVVFDVWQWTPFVTFIVLAGLQSLRQEPYEAAAIDGASGWQVFTKLTLPMLRPLIFLAFLFRMIDLTRYYDGIYAMTQGGPGTATETISWFLYRMGFYQLNMGSASATSIIVLYFTLIIAVIALRMVNRATESQ
jgi:multiple sugar transport system permease protein